MNNFMFLLKIEYLSDNRKSIGYLYAIYHGAEVIYETEDYISHRDGLLGFKHIKLNGLIQTYSGKKIDQLSHFLYSDLLSTKKNVMGIPTTAAIN